MRCRGNRMEQDGTGGSMDFLNTLQFMVYVIIYSSYEFHFEGSLRMSDVLHHASALRRQIEMDGSW